MGQTADQIRQLAQVFTEMSSAVDNYRTQHFDELDTAERLRLEQLFQELCDLHDDFTALAIQNTLDGIQSDLNHVVEVTTEAKQSLAHLNTIAEITKLVSATLELGAAISSGDYGAIPSALKDVVQSMQKTPDHISSGSSKPGS